MAWRERTGLVVLVLVALVLASVPATIGGLAEPTGLDEPPLRAGSVWSGPDMDQFQAAMAWSSAHEASLLSPLLPGAGLYGLMDETLHAYEEGQAWAEHRLAVEDRASLEAGLTALLAPYGVAPLEDGVGEIPAAWVAPVATLVRAQLQHHAPALPPAPQGAGTLPPGPSLAAIEENLAQGAWLLGVVDVVEPVLDAAREVLPEEPVLVDPVGFVIIGGTGDNVYEKPDLPAWWNGAILVVEPGGDDTYEVTVGSHGSLERPGPGGRNSAIHPALSLEIDGNDTYLNRVGRVTTLGSVGISLDQRGDDTYSKQGRPRGVAMAAGGFAYVADRVGNDVYQAREHGIAYAGGEIIPGQLQAPAVAVLADWEGDDQYLADTGQNSGNTHAAATDFGALAILRDYAGDDTYVSNIISQATAEDGGIALLIDDEGDDTHTTDRPPGSVSYGTRTFGEGGLDGPGNVGLAYYLDGIGWDTWNHECCPKIENNFYRIHDDADRRWSIFLDCTTPEDANVPCEQHQETVVRNITQSAPLVPPGTIPE